LRFNDVFWKTETFLTTDRICVLLAEAPGAGFSERHAGHRAPFSWRTSDGMEKPPQAFEIAQNRDGDCAGGKASSNAEGWGSLGVKKVAENDA
jgi:hypothetical protein